MVLFSYISFIDKCYKEKSSRVWTLMRLKNEGSSLGMIRNYDRVNLSECV